MRTSKLEKKLGFTVFLEDPATLVHIKPLFHALFVNFSLTQAEKCFTFAEKTNYEKLY
jgi:hypothetical protein